jgi:hypothetical protein
LENLGDVLIPLTVYVFHDQHQPVLRRQAVQGLPDAFLLLSQFHRVFRSVGFRGLGRIREFLPTSQVRHPLLSLVVHSRVHGNAVKPCKKARIVLDRPQGLEGAQKGVLNYIPSIFTVFDEPIYRIVKPVLVASYQFLKRRSPTREARGN